MSRYDGVYCFVERAHASLTEKTEILKLQHFVNEMHGVTAFVIQGFTFCEQ